MRSRLKFSRATKVIMLVGVMIMVIALCQEGINALLMTRDIKQRAQSQLEAAAHTTLDRFGTTVGQSAEDLKILLAHKAIENYFTALAFEDIDEMTGSAALFESFLKEVYAAKPRYAKIQLAQAGGAPFLQINKGVRVESFAPFAEIIGPANRQRLLAPATDAAWSSVLHTSFLDQEDGWVVLSAAPIRYRGVTEGLLWLYQPVSTIFQKVLADLGKNGIACTIMDREGNLIARSDTLGGTPAADSGDWLSTEMGFYPLGWTVKVGMPEKILYAQHRKFQSIGLIAFLVSLGVAMGALWGLKIYQEGLERKIEEHAQQLLDRNARLEKAHDALMVAKDELQKKKEAIEADRQKIQGALDEIFSLIQKVSAAKNFEVKFAHPALKKCWEAMRCEAKECPCYGKGPQRCWQAVGFYSESPDPRARCYQQGLDCQNCPFYKEVTYDPIFQIGEQFNNMMHILKSQNAELQKAYSELKASQAQMLQQEKMATVGQLAAGVAHEINNPLGFIISNIKSLQKYIDRILGFVTAQTECLASGSAPSPDLAGLEELKKKIKLDYITADIQNLLDESLEGAERVREIVHNLKKFSHVDQAQRRQVNINDCLEDTIKVIWNELKYKATVNREYGDLPATLCFPQQLNQVFMNLLINASQALEGQGEITVKTWAQDGTVFVSVADTGQGIPGNQLNRIFEPFFTTKEVGKGTGLGLSISYDIIVKNHGGKIAVHSKEGKGSIFTVQLPAADPDAPGVEDC